MLTVHNYTSEFKLKDAASMPFNLVIIVVFTKVALNNSKLYFLVARIFLEIDIVIPP